MFPLNLYLTEILPKQKKKDYTNKEIILWNSYNIHFIIYYRIYKYLLFIYLITFALPYADFKT